MRPSQVSILPYQIDVDSRQGVVRIRVVGDLTLEDAFAARDASAQALRRYRLCKVLTDMRNVCWKMDVQDALRFGLSVIRGGFPGNVRFATLARPDDLIPRTAIRASAITGIQIRNFAAESDALAYLQDAN